MPICLSGLDLSFMRDNPLPPREPREERPDFSDKRATGIAIPAFMPDIKPFLAVSTVKPEWISSRTALRRYEISNGLRQAGDIKPGEIAAENNAKKAELVKKSRGVKHGWQDFKE
jgi:hypothetical protein